MPSRTVLGTLVCGFAGNGLKAALPQAKMTRKKFVDLWSRWSLATHEVIGQFRLLQDATTATEVGFFLEQHRKPLMVRGS